MPLLVMYPVGLFSHMCDVMRIQLFIATLIAAIENIGHSLCFINRTGEHLLTLQWIISCGTNGCFYSVKKSMSRLFMTDE
jgi:hypothetical protein